jgi:hypothetical protein
MQVDEGLFCWSSMLLATLVCRRLNHCPIQGESKLNVWMGLADILPLLKVSQSSPSPPPSNQSFPVEVFVHSAYNYAKHHRAC